MSWIAVGVMATVGVVNANEEQKSEKKRNLAAAEHNRYSNWTGRTMNQSFEAPSLLGGAMQGGMAGFGAAGGMGGAAGGAGAVGGANNFSKAYTKSGVNHTGGPQGMGTSLGANRNPYAEMAGGRRTFYGQ